MYFKLAYKSDDDAVCNWNNIKMIRDGKGGVYQRDKNKDGKDEIVFTLMSESLLR